MSAISCSIIAPALRSFSSLGVGDSRVLLPPRYTYLIVPLILRRVFADHERQEAMVRQTALDWTLIRPGALSEGPQSGDYRHGFGPSDPPSRLAVSYADVADFMLRELTGRSYVRCAPALSY